MDTRNNSREREDGQAIIEFVVGLVAVLAIFAGLMQVASLTMAHTDTMVEARHAAAERATTGFSLFSDAPYIRDWQVGTDGKPYTRDDRPTPGNGMAFADGVVDRAATDTAAWDLVNAVGGNSVTALRGNASPCTEFGLVDGASTRSVELLPYVRHLIYDAPSIELKCEVWMTETSGFY